MKKIISYLVVSIFCFNIFGINSIFSFDEKASYVKEMAIKKSELNKSKKGQQYVKVIDAFIEANKDDEKKLLEINNRLIDLVYSGTLKNDDLGNTIRYLNAKVNVAILDMEDNKINDILNPNINENDKKVVNDRILKLQSNLTNSSKTLIENLTKEFENMNNYSETGNLKISLDIDEKNIGKINSSIELNNYEAIANNFDSQLKGQLKTILNAIPAGQNEVRFELDTFIDFITKDGNIYLLLKDLNILNDKGIEEVKGFITEFEKLAKENKYIVYEDNNTKMSLELLKSINPTNIGADINKALSKPLFEAYKKDGNKYYIKPTKYSCDQIKELENKFDPLYGKECSESQYKDMLKDFYNLGIIYLVIDGENNTLGFEGIKDNQLEKNLCSITFNNKEILSASCEIIPDQNRYPNEHLKANYINRNNINIDLYADSGEIDIKLNIKLDSNNLVNSIDLKSKIYDSNLISNINISNQNINGKTTFSEKLEKIFEVDTTGRYSKETLELNNKFNINDKSLNDYLGNNLTGNLNLKTDISSGKNNFYMIFDIISNNSKLIKFEIDSKANRKYGNYEIKTPTNIIDYKEAFGIPDYNDDYYYDDSFYYDDSYYYDY